MQMNEVRKIAKGMGINTFGMKKADIIRAVQNEEHAVPCYGTSRVGECNEEHCLWRPDCLSMAAGPKTRKKGGKR